MLGRTSSKSTPRVLDLKYLATFRSSVQRAPAVEVPERVPDHVPTPRIQTPVLAPSWPHYVFATSAVTQPCFDNTDVPLDGADLEEDERVLLVLDGDVCRTTRVATTGEMFTTRVDKNKFKDFQPLP